MFPTPNTGSGGTPAGSGQNEAVIVYNIGLGKMVSSYPEMNEAETLAKTILLYSLCKGMPPVARDFRVIDRQPESQLAFGPFYERDILSSSKLPFIIKEAAAGGAGSTGAGMTNVFGLPPEALKKRGNGGTRGRGGKGRGGGAGRGGGGGAGASSLYQFANGGMGASSAKQPSSSLDPWGEDATNDTGDGKSAGGTTGAPTEQKRVSLVEKNALADKVLVDFLKSPLMYAKEGASMVMALPKETDFPSLRILKPLQQGPVKPFWITWYPHTFTADDTADCRYLHREIQLMYHREFSSPTMMDFCLVGGRLKHDAACCIHDLPQNHQRMQQGDIWKSVILQHVQTCLNLQLREVGTPDPHAIETKIWVRRCSFKSGTLLMFDLIYSDEG